MGSLKELLALASSQKGYLEKTGTGHLEDFEADAGYKDYTKYARDVNRWGLAGCQGQPWCATYQFWLQPDPGGSGLRGEVLGQRRKGGDPDRGFLDISCCRRMDPVGKGIL